MNKIKLMLFIILLAGGISCHQESSTMSEKEKTAPRSLDRSQITYGPRLDPNWVSDKQLDDLRKYIDIMLPPSYEVWFVHVLYNRDDYLTARIYLKSEQTENRIRKGHYLGYDSMWIDIKLINPALAQSEVAKMMPEYMQVSLREIPFDAQLEPPTQDSMFPFAVPEEFSEQEITEIVDFIRSGPTVKPKEKIVKRVQVISDIDSNNIKENDYSSSLFTCPCWSSMFTSLYTQHSDPEPWETIQYESTGTIGYPETPDNKPIISIEHDGEFINIRTGSVEGVVSGGGESIIIKKTNDGYELVSIGIWYS